MTRDEVKNKEDFVHFILLELNKKVYPIKFGEFFLELMPNGGLDNFRNLLDELFENKLITRISEPGGSVSGLPGYTTIDLRYGISLKGINYLKDIGLIPSIKHENMKKEVFVTYSYDSAEHIEKVLSFTNLLRDEGFDAEMDKRYTQKESAADFYKMMHQAMTDYEKVIIVLSSGYKDKAENFKGGVGSEYNLIIKDIETQKNKYILVSFEPISDKITPLNFKGRQIVDLSNKANLNELYAKLQDEQIIEFAEIGKKKPIIEKIKIPKFELKQPSLEIGRLIFNINNASLFSKLYRKIEFDLNLEIVNNTTQTFSEYNIEIHYPINSTDFDVNGRIENKFKIVTHDANPKIFPGQTRSIKLSNFIIRNDNASQLLESSIIVKIYTESGAVEKEFPLQDSIIVRTDYGEQNLTVAMFQDKNYR